MEEFQNGNNENIINPCLFSNSNGSCLLPKGVFFDKFVENGKMQFYNIGNENADISLKNDFLGYIQYIGDEAEMEDNIDLNSLQVNNIVSLKTISNIVINPYTSMEICVGKVNVIKGNESNNVEGYKLMKFPELVSAKNGLVLTQELLEIKNYDNLNITVYNVTNQDIMLENGDIVAKVLVAQACDDVFSTHT